MSAPLGTLVDLRRHPVKSLQGETVDALLLTATGAADDRRWAIVADGRPLTAKRVPALFEATARLEGARVEIRLPGERVVRSDDTDVDAVLSDWLGRPVSLVEAEDEPWVDDAPIHLLTRSSLVAMGQQHPDGRWDARRFRPNLVVDAAADGLIEETWIGQTIGLGTDGVELEVVERTVRCAMTNHAQVTLPEDPAILRTLGRVNDACLGVYARVVTPGVVLLGDTLHR